MKIHDRHQFHGAALIQIAEDSSFTAINAFHYKGEKSVNSYAVNDDIGVYFKYATDSHGKFSEYKFTFTQDHLHEIAALKMKQDRVFVALVCWKAREVCCLRYSQLLELIDARREANGQKEAIYSIYVRAPNRANFRVYVSPPGKKMQTLGEKLVRRSAFPSFLFEK